MAALEWFFAFTSPASSSTMTIDFNPDFFQHFLECFRVPKATTKVRLELPPHLSLKLHWTSYGVSIKKFHNFCDAFSTGIAKEDRLPASFDVLHLEGPSQFQVAISDQTTRHYLSAIRAWHIEHGWDPPLLGNDEAGRGDCQQQGRVQPSGQQGGHRGGLTRCYARSANPRIDVG